MVKSLENVSNQTRGETERKGKNNSIEEKPLNKIDLQMSK